MTSQLPLHVLRRCTPMAPHCTSAMFCLTPWHLLWRRYDSAATCFERAGDPARAQVRRLSCLAASLHAWWQSSWLSPAAHQGSRARSQNVDLIEQSVVSPVCLLAPLQYCRIRSLLYEAKLKQEESPSEGSGPGQLGSPAAAAVPALPLIPPCSLGQVGCMQVAARAGPAISPHTCLP